MKKGCHQKSKIQPVILLSHYFYLLYDSMNFMRIYPAIAFHEHKNLPLLMLAGLLMLGVSMAYFPNDSSRESHELK
jgi:hypothetical protein